MLEPGALLDGKYRIVRLLGRGGMGMVYEGVNVRIDRRVAIKTMLATLAADPGLVARFEREAQAASRIGSSHIVDVLDLGDLPDGQRYLVMEFLEGETLLERTVRHVRLPPRMLAEIGVQLSAGLAKVHEAGIIHRDLKPGNVFLVTTPEGGDFVKILDFGVCKFRESLGEATALGSLLGTLLYTAPEHIEHGPKALDPRSDIYSVGVMLFRCAAGRFPYDAKNPVDLQMQMRAGQPPTLRELFPDIDVEFAAIVDRATEWDPRARYASATDLQADLEGWLERVRRRELLLTDFLGAPSPPPRPSAGPAPRRTTSAALPAPELPPRADTAPPTLREGARDLGHETERLGGADDEIHIDIDIDGATDPLLRRS